MAVAKTLEQLYAENNANHGGTYTIRHNGGIVHAPMNEFLTALLDMRALPAWQRKAMSRVIKESIDRVEPAVKAGTAPLQTAIEMAQDVTLWHAIEVVEGRAEF